MMKRLNRILKDKRGFTLIEMIVVLAVIAALTAVLTPMVISYIKDAKLQRAQSDVKMIGSAIGAFNKDMREWPIWAAGAATTAGDVKHALLSSAGGDEPGDTLEFLVAGAVLGTTDTLEDQLITNVPAYPTTGKRKWMGPYLEKMSEDPWGNKYYVTVFGLQPANLTPGSEKAVFVVSAGPNEELETDLNVSVTAFSAGGDDITYRIQ